MASQVALGVGPASFGSAVLPLVEFFDDAIGLSPPRELRRQARLSPTHGGRIEMPAARRNGIADKLLHSIIISGKRGRPPCPLNIAGPSLPRNQKVACLLTGFQFARSPRERDRNINSAFFRILRESLIEIIAVFLVQMYK